MDEPPSGFIALDSRASNADSAPIHHDLLKLQTVLIRIRNVAVVRRQRKYARERDGMDNFSQLTPQQRLIQYRERACFAIERAARHPDTRGSYLDIARSWNALAEALELELDHA